MLRVSGYKSSAVIKHKSPLVLVIAANPFDYESH